MIDTIKLVLHNYSRYPNIYNTIKNSGGNVLSEINIPKNKYDSLYKTKSVRAFLAFYGDTQKLRIVERPTKITVPSWKYEITVRPKRHNDTLDVILSIPKYIYGHNVRQFVEHPTGRHSLNSLIDFDRQKHYVYKKFIAFMNGFFPVMFNENVRKEDIQIMRMDICFNQFFNNVDDKLRYIKLIKPIRKRHSKGALPVDYKNTVFYPSSRQTFKIYEKGAEFKKHDLQQLRKYNDLAKKKGKKSINLTKIAEMADLCLRYEMSYTNAGISYLYKHKIMSQMKHYKEPYKNYMGLVSKGSKKGVVLTRDEKLYMKEWRRHFEGVIDMRLGVPLRIAGDNYVKFTYEIFSNMVDKFKKDCKQYSLDKPIDVRDFANAIKSKTFKAKNRYQGVSICHGFAYFVELLVNNDFNYAVVREMGNFPNSTYYKYVNDLKKLGITENVVDSTKYVKLNPFDYERYFDLLFYK